MLSENDLHSLVDLKISEWGQNLAQKNLKKNGEEKESQITLYSEDKNHTKIILFFPESEKLMDERSQLFRDFPHKALFIPSRDAWEAFEALILASYRYQPYLSKKKQYVYELFVWSADIQTIQNQYPMFESILDARDSINQPPSDKYPEAIVKSIKQHEWKNFDLHIFDHKDLKKMGCNLLLAVGAGSNFPPYMVVLTPKKAPEGEKYALIGKGVTFDAGGIQIKPDTAMLDMKCDMSGAAGMLWVARYLDTLPSLPVNVIFALGLTENMTGGKAYKPLDIYKAHNGTTVEIHHTDAEGRLVLADVMSYIETTYQVDHIITMATLTGACVYALGHDIAGIMGDDEEIISALLESNSIYEPLWRLPLNEKLKKSLKADIADIKNVARSEKAGSSIWGAFLSYFQWKAKLTHLDIAGPAYRETNWWYMPKWGTGWWVRILSDFLLSRKDIKKWKSSK